MAKVKKKYVGEVEVVFQKELTEKELDITIKPKTGPNAGKVVKLNEGKTHRISLICKLNPEDDRGVFFNWGSVNVFKGTRIGLYRKDMQGDDKYLNPGAKVDFRYDEEIYDQAAFDASGGEKGVSRQIEKGSLWVEENGPTPSEDKIWTYGEKEGDSAGQSTKSPEQKKQANDEVVAWNAIQIAKETYPKKTGDDLTEVCKLILPIMEDIKAGYKTANPSLSDYDVGMRVGAAGLRVAKGIKNVGELEFGIQEMLAKTFPDVVAFIKGEDVPGKPETKVQQQYGSDNSLAEEDDIPF